MLQEVYRGIPSPSDRRRQYLRQAARELAQEDIAAVQAFVLKARGLIKICRDDLERLKSKSPAQGVSKSATDFYQGLKDSLQDLESDMDAHVSKLREDL